MSYILDALRRLEKDKEAAKKGINPLEAILSGDPHGMTKNLFKCSGSKMHFLLSPDHREPVAYIGNGLVLGQGLEVVPYGDPLI